MAATFVVDSMVNQPDAIHVPYMPQKCAPEHEFADRLRTVVAILIRADDKFGIDDPVRTWLWRVPDWSGVEWEQVAAVLSDRARSAASPCRADRGTAMAA